METVQRKTFTKQIIIKRTRKKTHYKKINNETRQKLIEMVVNLY
jgi:hypothetical protein